MPQVDVSYGVGDLYTPGTVPVESYTWASPNGTVATPRAGVASPPPAPSSPASSPASSAPSGVNPWTAVIQNSPEYKQALENVSLWGKQQQGQIDFDTNWANQFYQQNLSQIGAGDAVSAEQDALNRAQGTQALTSRQKEIELARQKAQRDFEQQRKYITEALTGRGNAGGQLGFEKGNLQFGFDQFLQGQALNAENAQFAYDSLLKEIDLQGKRRELDKTAARSDLELKRQYSVAQAELAKKNLTLAIAQKNGEALISVQEYLTEVYFDKVNNRYFDPATGQWVSLEQARASLSQGGTEGGTETPTSGSPSAPAPYSTMQFYGGY